LAAQVGKLMKREEGRSGKSQGSCWQQWKKALLRWKKTSITGARAIWYFSEIAQYTKLTSAQWQNTWG
jgi:hypothetical protein